MKKGEFVIKVDKIFDMIPFLKAFLLLLLFTVTFLYHVYFSTNTYHLEKNFSEIVIRSNL